MGPCLQAEDGPVDAPKTVADVRQEPYNLPPGCAQDDICHQHDSAQHCGAGCALAFLVGEEADGAAAWLSRLARSFCCLGCRFVWSVCDMTDQETVAQVHDLLARNYVEDDDEMFRCAGLITPVADTSCCFPDTFCKIACLSIGLVCISQLRLGFSRAGWDFAHQCCQGASACREAAY